MLLRKFDTHVCSKRILELVDVDVHSSWQGVDSTREHFDVAEWRKLTKPCIDLSLYSCGLGELFHKFHSKLVDIVEETFGGLMEKIWSVLPDMYIMNAFIGSDLAGASAISQAFLILRSSVSACVGGTICLRLFWEAVSMGDSRKMRNFRAN